MLGCSSVANGRRRCGRLVVKSIDVKSFLIGILLLSMGVFFSGCKAFVPVIDLKKVDAKTLSQAGKVKVFFLGQKNPDFDFIDSITTYSVQNKVWDPPATKGNATQQARVLCVRKGGNALVNATFDAKGTSFSINSWETWVLSADVVRLKVPKPDRGPTQPIDRSIKSTGTGFFITDDGYILTNHHVIDAANSVSIKTAIGVLRATVVKVDKLNDLAVLKVEGKFKALPIVSSRKVGLGDEVFTVGFPQVTVQGFSPKLTKGAINSLAGIKDDPRNFQISVPIQPGNSGGPLVNEYGNVVGVVVSRLNAIKLLKETGSLPQNVNYAVKSSFANSFLESLPKVVGKLKEPHPRTKRKFSDAVKEVQAATVLILVR
jgi:S1-C subfamily serine protease